MTNEELQQLVINISETVFHKPFKHEAYFNSRLKTTGGRYMLQTHHIQINPKSLELHGRDELEGIIRHELCHYHLHIEGKGYKHRDKEFKDLLKVTKSPRFCANLGAVKRKKKETQHVYGCISCGLLYRRKIRLNTNKYRCGKCSGRLIKVE
ncbi:SprT family protein [Paenisporosarcina quisquiliarum]|uniref:Protein SprT-like n=1 Tax=Paenisporosarcina quisquiliarum TaxID=365346 RepID=A0A9X3RDU9_9BACL|nr:SprT family protein [Paenisporosarcina quisquiliarum]MCZ8536688.1 SprT family protein [Paenisporosarcina quisquiliarum]